MIFVSLLVHLPFISLFVFSSCSLLFFFTATATTEIYTLSLHDALPIWSGRMMTATAQCGNIPRTRSHTPVHTLQDRKSTRLNSSHLGISYAVFCLKKKKYTS